MGSYQELAPEKRLQNIVSCYWISETPDKQTQYIQPDGCTDVIFNLGNVVSAEEKQAGLPQESISAVGMMTECKKVNIAPKTRLVGIRFKTGAMSTITDLPLHKFQDINIDAEEISPCLNQATWEKIVKVKSLNNLASELDNLIFEMKSKSDKEIDPVAITSVKYIRQRTETIAIGDIANKFSISQRQLERRFRSSIGVTMKGYTRIVRFLNTKSLLSQYPEKSILSIALENGYYDHAHLTREFKLMAGINPSKMR